MKNLKIFLSINIVLMHMVMLPVSQPLVMIDMHAREFARDNSVNIAKDLKKVNSAITTVSLEDIQNIQNLKTQGGTLNLKDAFSSQDLQFIVGSVQAAVDLGTKS